MNILYIDKFKDTMITINLILKIKLTQKLCITSKKEILINYIPSTDLFPNFFAQIRSEYIQILFIYFSKKKEIKKKLKKKNF
jgi:hypothetical protein